MPIYATLGPAGTNHDLVLKAYLARDSSTGEVLLCSDLDAVLHACVGCAASHMMICAAHPDAARIVSTAQYAHGILLIDSFIAESQPLAILTRRDVETPRSIALHPSTRGYANVSGYETIHEVASTVAAFEGLVESKWDSALTAARFADASDARVLTTIDPPRDAWLVLGREAGAEVLSV